MAYLICLFFPSFISLKKLISQNDKNIDILIKYVCINLIVNFFSFFVVWLITNSTSLIDANIMTIPFFIKYLFISSCIALALPNIYSILKNNIKIEAKRK